MERCDSWRVDLCQGGGDLPLSLNSRNEDALEVEQHGRDCQNNPNARGQLCERLPLVHILGILHSLECCLDAAQLFQRWMQKMLVEYLTKSSTNSQMCILCKFLRNIDKSFDFYLRVGNIFLCVKLSWSEYSKYAGPTSTSKTSSPSLSLQPQLPSHWAHHLPCHAFHLLLLVPPQTATASMNYKSMTPRKYKL